VWPRRHRRQHYVSQRVAECENRCSRNINAARSNRSPDTIADARQDNGRLTRRNTRYQRRKNDGNPRCSQEVPKSHGNPSSWRLTNRASAAGAEPAGVLGARSFYGTRQAHKRNSSLLGRARQLQALVRQPLADMSVLT
jgi:hypothetical protein